MASVDPRLSVAERVDAACDAFEREWRAGRSPRVEDYLAAVPEPDRDTLRSALVAVETELKTGGPSLPSSDGVGTGDHFPAVTVQRPSDAPAVPQRIGRFEVRGLLGAGAFGRVYRAFDPDLDREVAVKVPVPEALRTVADRDRFLKEARAAATVSHPNVCQIHEIGEHDGVPYIVMALVRGHSLAEALRARTEPLPEKQVALVVRKLARALDAAHKKGVVHRDLKPANVMFDKERKDLVVMDFGLARRPGAGDARDTQTGIVMGTPAYMSPEQARGEAKDVGPAGDIFSLGIIMYELLTGARPFIGRAHEVIGRIILMDPAPPAALRPGVDPVLAAVCLKALAKAPAQRLASMKEFAAAMDVYLRESDPTAAGTDGELPYAEPADEDRSGARTIAALFDALSEHRESARAEAAEAVERAVAKARTPRWALVAVGLLVLGGLAAVAGAVYFTRSDKVQVTIKLTDVDLADKSLSFFLDDEPIAAERLAAPLKLSPGKHVLVVKRGGDVVKRLALDVTGGRTPGIEVKDEAPVEPAPPPSTADTPKPHKEPAPPSGTTTPNAPHSEEGFVSIFNGKDLTGWSSATRSESFVVDAEGCLTARGDVPGGRPHWLLTKKEYANYVLRLEFKIVSASASIGTVSGVALRSQPDGPGVRPHRLTVELGSQYRDQSAGSVLYTTTDAARPTPPLTALAPGQWHTLELEVRGSRVKVTIDDKLVNDVDLSKIDRALLSRSEKWAETDLDRARGHIGLKSLRNPMKFRSIRVKEL